jgi:hypothetical protein
MKSELENQEKEFNSSETKGQVTIYIDSQVLDLVDEAFYLSRRRVPRIKRGRLSKSKFYELIINAIISDQTAVANIISEWEKSENIT